MKFKIAIEETVVQVFEVEADTAEEALDMAQEKYRNGEFVIEAGEVTSKQMQITAPSNEATEWAEF